MRKFAVCFNGKNPWQSTKYISTSTMVELQCVHYWCPLLSKQLNTKLLLFATCVAHGLFWQHRVILSNVINLTSTIVAFCCLQEKSMILNVISSGPGGLGTSAYFSGSRLRKALMGVITTDSLNSAQNKAIGSQSIRTEEDAVVRMRVLRP